jgi:hypothetical protein
MLKRSQEFGNSGIYILFVKEKMKSRLTLNHPCTYVSKVIKIENKKNSVPK